MVVGGRPKYIGCTDLIAVDGIGDQVEVGDMQALRQSSPVQATGVQSRVGIGVTVGAGVSVGMSVSVGDGIGVGVPLTRVSAAEQANETASRLRLRKSSVWTRLFFGRSIIANPIHDLITDFH